MIRSAKPMIDLLMLLLLLFSGQQVATTIQEQEVFASQAQSVQSELESNDMFADNLRRMSIHLSSDGGLLLGNDEASLSDLVKKARAERVVKIYIDIDDNVSYSVIRKVIRELSDQGLSIELG